MNNRFILDKTTSKDNYAAALAADQRSDPEKLGELFLTAFSREPTPLEMRNAIEYLASETDKRKAYGNLLWALMNTKEFMYIH
jgi:hypothetical protein